MAYNAETIELDELFSDSGKNTIVINKMSVVFVLSYISFKIFESFLDVDVSHAMFKDNKREFVNADSCRLAILSDIIVRVRD